MQLTKRLRLVLAVTVLLIIVIAVVSSFTRTKTIRKDFVDKVKAYTDNVPKLTNPRPDEIENADPGSYLGDTLEMDPLEGTPKDNYADVDQDSPLPTALPNEVADPTAVEPLPLKPFAKVPSPESSKISGQLSLRLYSHNVKNGGVHKLVKGEPIWDKRKELLTSSIKAHLIPNTVIALQEAQKFQLDDILTYLNLVEEKSTQWVAYGGGRIDGRDVGEHVPLLVRKNEFEVIYDDTFWLNEQNERIPMKGWDAKYPRIASCVTLKHKATGTYLNLFNTHFDHKGEDARKQSAELLKSKMDSINLWPSFLLGDLNAKPGDQELKVLEDGYTDAHTMASLYNWYGHPDFSVTGFRGNYIKDAKRIDYIWVPAGTRRLSEKTCHDENPISLQIRGYGLLHSKFGGVYMSDHRPLMADLTIKGCSDRR